jgi:hypothetical protein
MEISKKDSYSVKLIQNTVYYNDAQIISLFNEKLIAICSN